MLNLKESKNRTYYEIRIDEENERYMRKVKLHAPEHCRNCKELQADIDELPLCNRHEICRDNPAECIELPEICIECGDRFYISCHFDDTAKIDQGKVFYCLDNR